MHSKADNTFSCRAGRQRVSVPVLARGGQAPACCHAHRDLAGGASSIRSRCPGSAAAGAAPRPVPARPRAGAGGAGPRRRPGSAADHRPGNGRCRAAGPRRRPCSRRRGTQSCGLALRRSCTGLRRPGGSRAYRLRSGAAAREPGPCPAGPQMIATGIPAVAGVPAPAKTFLPGRIRHGPSTYEMEGPCPASPRRLASCLVFAARRAPPAGARYPHEGPVSRLLPRSRGRPGWCPFPAVKHFYCLRGRHARACGRPFSGFSLSTKESTESGQLSAFDGGYPRAFSQPIHRFPSVSRRTPQPPVPNARCYVAS
jgi:hypothetical protein